MLLFRQAARAESTPYEPGAHQLGYCVHFGTQGPPAREKTHRTVSTPTRHTENNARISAAGCLRTQQRAEVLFP